MLAGSLVVFLIFARSEGVSARHCGTPNIDAAIFKKRAYTFRLTPLGQYFAGFAAVIVALPKRSERQEH